MGWVLPFLLSASVNYKLFSLVSVSAGLFSLFVSASASAILPVLLSILPLLLESLSLFRSVSLRLPSLYRIFSAIILALYGVFACCVANYCLYLAVSARVMERSHLVVRGLPVVVKVRSCPILGSVSDISSS